MNKKLISLLLIFAVIIVGTFAISKFSKKDSDETINNSDNLNIVTSFYPIYVIALNITDGIDEVSIKNLTPNQTGCLHEYQFTTNDMKNLEHADAFIVNGGGMETFLLDVAKEYPNLDIVDTSKGITLLPTNELELDSKEEADENEAEYNSHIWLNTKNYMTQIQNTCDELCKIDNEHSGKYKENTEKYLNKINSLDNEIKSLKVENNEGVIIFHDAFAYLADEIGLTVSAAVDIDSETSSLSSGEIAAIIDEMNKDNIKYIFTEKQFKTSIADSIAAETSAKVYVFDSLVTGDDSKDAYIDGMENNLKTLKELFTTSGK